jgi:hypothetical protein
MQGADDGDVLKSFDTALWLLTARRQNIDTPLDDQWLWDEVRQLHVDSDDPAAYLESIGKLIGALIEVSSFFLTGWAHSSGEDPEAIVALTRRFCEVLYTAQEPASESELRHSREGPD